MPYATRKPNRGAGSALPGTLSADTYWAVAQLVLQGRSGADIGRTLRGQGLSFSNERLYTAIREITSATEKAPGISRTSGPFLVHEGLYKEVDWLEKGEHIVFFETPFTVGEGDAAHTLSVNMRFTGQRTADQIRSQALSILSSAIQAYGQTVSDEDLLAVQAYRGAGEEF